MSVLLIHAERQDREARHYMDVLTETEKLERSLTVVHDHADTAGVTALQADARECELRWELIRPSVTDAGSMRFPIDAHLRALQDSIAGIEGQPTEAQRDRIQELAGESVVAVNGLNLALANHHFGQQIHPFWNAIHAATGIFALLVVGLAIAQARANRALRQVYRDLHALMEGTPQVLVSCDLNGNLIRWNDRMLRATGLSARELAGARVTDLFAPEARPDVVQALDAVLERGSSESDIPLLQDGRATEFTWLFSRDGEVITACGRDISDRRAAERKLVETETRYGKLFERMLDGVFIVKGGRFVDVNPAMERILGFSREELIGMHANHLFDRFEDSRPFYDFAELHAVSGFNYDLRLRHESGRIIDVVVTASAILAADGSLDGFQGILRDVSEQRRLEEALKRSEAEYRGLFENAHEAILVLDPASEVVLDANRRACELYDLTPHELIGKSMIDLSVDPESTRDYRQQAIGGSGHYVSFESQQYRGDGSLMEVEIAAACVVYGGREAILSINRDATLRKREERRVRESEERFRLLVESVIDYAIYMLDPEGQVVSWNEGAERISGFAAADVLGQSFAMFYTADQQAAGVPRRDLDEALRSGRAAGESLHVRRDGTSFDASVVLTRIVDELGTLRGFARVTHDITQKKAYEQSQRETLALIQTVASEWSQTFDAVTVPILLLDDEGRIRRLNAAAARAAGISLKMLVHREVRELDGQPWQAIANAFEFYRAHGVSTGARATDVQTGRVWEVSSTPVELHGDQRLIVVAYDLTLITQLEESLRRSELAATLGALVAGVAHEVRNPLFTITATLDAFEARFDTPDVRRYTDPLRTEIDHLNGLMRDLLDYGKPPALYMADVSLAEVARAAIAQTSASGRTDVEVRLEAGDLPLVHGDRARLQQVLRNIVENAVACADGVEPVLVRLRDDGDCVTCEILDDGRGFSPEDLARAFTPFYTKRKGGTGLGLPIAQKIIAAHGGEITLGNREAGGAAVTIRLPRPAAQSYASETEAC